MIHVPAGVGELVAALSIFGGIVTIAAGTVKAALYLIRILRRLDRVLTQWWGEEGRPGVLDRMGSLEATAHAMNERLERLEAQMIPNGGGSLRDAVDRAAAAATAAGDRSHPPDGGAEQPAVAQQQINGGQ